MNDQQLIEKLKSDLSAITTAVLITTFGIAGDHHASLKYIAKLCQGSLNEETREAETA